MTHASAALVGERGQGRASVGRMLDPLDEAVEFEPVDGVRDAGGVHLEPLPDLAERQPAGAREVEEHEHLEAGEGEPHRPEGCIDPTEQDLVGTHDRGDQRHARRRVGPSGLAPVPRRFVDRIEAEGLPACHGAEL